MRTRNKNLLVCALAASSLWSASAVADGVNSVKVTPSTGPAGSVFTATVQGKGNCPVQFYIYRAGPDGYPFSLMANANGPFNVVVPVVEPGGNPLRAGKYTLQATTLAQDHPGCVLHQQAQTDITVSEKEAVVTPNPIGKPSQTTPAIVKAVDMAGGINPGIIQVNPPAVSGPRIVSVSATPTDTTVNTDVVMDAHLDGDIELCKAVVSWGDGSGIPSTDIHHYNLPTMSYIHKYANPGTYVASVMPTTPASGCTGGGRVVIKVGPSPSTGGTPGYDPTGKPTTPTTGGTGTNPGTDPNGKPTTPTTPPLGKLTGLTLSGGTLTNAPNMFKTTDVLSATAQGITGGKCGVVITSTATFAQPAGFTTDASSPFPVTQKFMGLKPGMQSVTATPTANGSFPACQGAPITVNFTVK